MCLTPFDVFNPDKVPEATYTSRQSDSMGDPPFDPRMYGTYEDWLSSEFKRNNGGFVIHGMTKMGKTSMVERALDGAGKSALTIEGTTIDTIEDFYSQIVTELELTQEWSVNNEKTGATPLKLNFIAGLHISEKSYQRPKPIRLLNPDRRT
ncbi:hypothetical protein [Corynebacterium sp. CCUG 51687]|uniref:hypothetical protein n=1 Tax=Corynebacterium sp. CCUG 51687 TaxID=2823897 RepID=UPI00210D0E18|nr:hypothetical protein [Corynebacterium sp. CCUG 51687]MCQ4612269.1 hypothetical protein [Corynebacterium sp. CCUG 51687]